ncbi:hypothetical protein EVAR_84196_1 [Eumeta japonica]|uniref:Uncharacterized protein n=1 Tax=Eumeta variegata TaxID=151549 RepID=A0A4C1S7J1_EUMVA|nr:hypothetical protein EVAR_84196_1 [Eumeta japonica]
MGKRSGPRPHRNSKRRLKPLVESRVRGLKGCAHKEAAHPKRAPSRREYVVGEYVQAKEVYERQRLRRRPRAGSGFALHRTGEPVGRIYRVIRKREKPGGYLPNRLGTSIKSERVGDLLAETFFP